MWHDTIKLVIAKFGFVTSGVAFPYSCHGPLGMITRKVMFAAALALDSIPPARAGLNTIVRGVCCVGSKTGGQP